MNKYIGIILCGGIIFTFFTGCNSTTGGGGEEVTLQGATNKKMPNGGEVNGPRSIENVEKNMAVLMPRLEHFYSKIQKENPGFQGTIELLFDVDSKGSVTYVNVGKTTFKDPLFIEDVLTALSNHQFDSFGGGKERTEIIYPITFMPEKEVTEQDAGEEQEGIEE